MRFERTPRFDKDFRALAPEHQQLFRACVRDFHDGCVRYVEQPSSTAWPARLRVRKMTSAPRIWEMTWSFSSPDGRATFEFLDRDGETSVLWRRIGTHVVFTSP